MERNKVKISCNPYSKEINYKRWGSDQWLDLGRKSTLLNEKYTRATIQHNAEEVVHEINQQYNPGNTGLDIIFEGTIDDYNDFKNVVDSYFSKEDIRCILGERYILMASEVMPKIQGIFDEIACVFKDYSNDTVKRELSRFHDATKTTIPICVMGLYSSGKSAFINSLIGKEILPSATNPTTAKNYRITASERVGKIKFQYKGEPIELIFDGEQYKPSKSAESDLIRKLQRIVTDNSAHDQEVHMYKALQIINAYDNDAKNKMECISDLVEVEVPFCNGILDNENYDFVIYDTPGSNSASHLKHIEVLMKSLRGQTNGLPVFITTPNTMDSTDNDKIINIIDQMGDSLDTTNTMVIVNRSDEISSEDLEIKRQGRDTKLKRWKSTRIYFVSSILGLGSKKKQPLDKTSWIDNTYSKVFKTQYDSFADSDDDFYLQLYKYNIMPKARYDEINAEMGMESSENGLIYANSGLLCVEKEIAAFANRHALYNKCSKAQDYLEEAMDITSENIVETEQEQEQLREAMKLKLDEKEKSVLDELESKVRELSDKFTDEYPRHMSTFISKKKDGYKKKNVIYIADLWSKYIDTDKNTRVSKTVDEAEANFQSITPSLRSEIIDFSEEFIKSKNELFRKECCSLVKENKRLNAEEKDYIRKYVMSIPPIKTKQMSIAVKSNDVSKYVIDILGFKAFNTNNLNVTSFTDKYNIAFENYIAHINHRTIEAHKIAFEQWGGQLKNGLQEKVSYLNPVLREYSIKLDKLNEKLCKIKEQKELILSSQKKINCLLDYWDKEEDLNE